MSSFKNLTADQIKGFIQLGLVVAFILASFAVSNLLNVTKKPLRPTEVEERTLLVQTVRAAPGAHYINFTLNGLIKARADIALTPEVSGRIIHVNDDAFAGGAFTAGELLFQVDPTDYQLAVKQLEATVAQAMTDYNLEEAESKIAQEEWKQLHGKKPIPDLVARKPQLDEAWANLQSAKAQLEKATLDLERTVFSLPFNGRITDSDLAVGQYVAMGQSYGSAYDFTAMEVQASLDEKRLAWLLDAQDPALAITTHYQGQEHTYKGRLIRGAAQLDTANRFGQIALAFDQSDAEVPIAMGQNSAALLPGVFAEIAVRGPQLNGLIRVPSSALQKGSILWTVNPADQTLQMHQADIVYNDGAFVLLRGFDQETLLVVSKISGASQGMRVEYEMLASAQEAR